MSSARLDHIAWLLIFGGMLVASVGWLLPDDAGTLAGALLASGAVAAAAGVLLIGLRARRSEAGAAKPAPRPAPSAKETPR